ncbi:MAG TPA: hypothetical protein DEH02_10680 [Bacteroidales bacterium]|nr:hypothetical protein [Bacteroidales bacterium]
MHRNTIFYLIIFLVIASCKVIKPTAPPVKIKPPVIELKPSFISLPIEIDIKNVETMVNKELQGLLYEDNSFADDDLKVKAWKKENFTISIKGNELYYRIPLKLSIIYKKFIEFPEVSAEIAVKFKTQFVLNNDWSLGTKTNALGYEWISTPVIKVGSFEIPIKSLADIVLLSSKNMIAKEVDASIKSYVNVRSYAEEAWAMLHKPIHLNKDFNLWLKMVPTELIAVPVMGLNNKVNIAVAIKSVNELLMTKEIPHYTEKKFPDLKIAKSLEPGFSMNLNIGIPFTQLNEIANKELTGKTFESGMKKVEIKRINVYGSEDSFVIDVTLDGSVKGDVYLKGKPFYDKENNIISIKELSFDLDTKNKLIKAANWLLHGGFVKMIENRMKIPLSEKIGEIKKLAQENLSENRSVKGLVLKSDLKNIEIDQLYITSDELRAVVFIEGKLAFIVEDLMKISE